MLNKSAIRLHLRNNDARLQYISRLENYESYLTDIESRFHKFLDSDIQSSLMDLEEYLHELRFEFIVSSIYEEDSGDIIESFPERTLSDSFERMKNIIEKIMGIIQIIRSKIDVGF